MLTMWWHSSVPTKRGKLVENHAREDAAGNTCAILLKLRLFQTLTQFRWTVR